MRLHVHHEFHAVGHGTFFVGNLLIDESQSTGNFTQYQWIFDCGSRRSSQIAKAISSVEKSKLWKKETDLLVVSHFDNDHINGLEQLLENNNVRTLVLPYASYRQRLACMASVHSSMEAVSPEVAAFGLDPVGYLSSRGLLEKISAIVFVTGGEAGAYDGGGSLFPDGETDNGHATRWSGTWGDSQYDRVTPTNVSGSTAFGLLPQNAPVLLSRFHWEFVFYNASLPDESATRSGASITEVQADVAGILRRNRVLQPGAQPKRGWRVDLRNCYIKHFGSSGPERNNISLCVLARPAGGYPVGACSVFSEAIERSAATFTKLHISDAHQSLLLTGDLEIDGRRMAAMQAHFRDWRWRGLSVMQIPHHGSRHSWKQGNSALANQRHSVLCVPTERGAGHHPHRAVLDDLRGHGAVYADYDQSVIQTYHMYLSR